LWDSLQLKTELYEGGKLVSHELGKWRNDILVLESEGHFLREIT